MGVKYPQGHVWGVAVTLPFVPPGVMRVCEQTGYLTVPDDLLSLPEYREGLPLQVLDQYCIKCRKKWADAQWEPQCPADDPTNRAHLRGGKRERAPRRRPTPGTTAAEIAAQQAAERATWEREPAHSMQQSRLPSF
ncbi:hypothetical protein [Thermobispora bispora]|uniref:hypothetical protein n=1 Tax=Thermobispora bispora TaxID=2006 RepID=UPI001981BB04|nr:hypothetical protein [Thermobispora bispora]QSI49935.1 hypothetical protein CYL17_18310 [Thermobispora bispora]QSI50037.1 hypothetical protein CYL17_18880 [Thermobispora bispora]